MGCVNTKENTKKHKKQSHEQTKNNPKNNSSLKKQHFKSATYTSIEEVLYQRDGSPKKSDPYLKSSQRAQIMGKYRMSAQQNKCAVPKINACQYGPLLIHNPGDFETPQDEGQSSPSHKKNQQVLLFQ